MAKAAAADNSISLTIDGVFHATRDHSAEAQQSCDANEEPYVLHLRSNGTRIIQASYRGRLGREARIPLGSVLVRKAGEEQIQSMASIPVPGDQNLAISDLGLSLVLKACAGIGNVAVYDGDVDFSGQFRTREVSHSSNLIESKNDDGVHWRFDYNYRVDRTGLQSNLPPPEESLNNVGEVGHRAGELGLIITDRSVTMLSLDEEERLLASLELNVSGTIYFFEAP